MSTRLKVQSVTVGEQTDDGASVSVVMDDGSRWVGLLSANLAPEVGQVYIGRWDGLAAARQRGGTRHNYVWLRRAGELPMHEDVPTPYGA